MKLLRKLLDLRKKNNPSFNSLHSGIFTSIALVALSLGALLFVAYLSLERAQIQRERDRYAQSGINQDTNSADNVFVNTEEGTTSGSTTTGQTEDNLPRSQRSVPKKIHAIKQESEAQLTIRQIENSKLGKQPEKIIGSLFQEFHGDLSAMQERK